MALAPAWAPLVRVPERAALLVDFDGTLAPIVADPARAVPLPEAVSACSRLSRRLAVVAVVTGRPVAFVRAHLPDAAVAVLGQYGLEREVDGVITVDPRVARFEDAVAGAAAEAERRWPGCAVERKGTVAFTVHWRRAAAPPPPGGLQALADRWGLVTFAGRMACELRPPIPVDKGTAVAGVVEGRDLAAAAFAGDDQGDLPAFAALATWAGAGADRVAVRVAVESVESPGGLIAAADIVVESPAALADQLTAVADAIGVSSD